MIESNIELYAPIKGFDGFYEVSTWGNVRSLGRCEVTSNKFKNKYKRYRKSKILKPGIDRYGYKRVVLCKNGVKKYITIHRLVAEAFLENPDNLPEINHKDEDKSNNRADNLEYCTHEYNINYGTHNERAAKSNINGKLSKKVYQYNLKGELVNTWISAAEAGRNGYNSGNINSCCRNESKTYKGYIWSHTKINNFNADNYIPKTKKVYQYDKDYNLINIWNSSSEAGRNGFDQRHISSCCNGKLKTHKGYIWSYSEIN